MRTQQRALGLFWSLSIDIPPHLESRIWAACCDEIRSVAISNGRRLVLPSVVTREVDDAPGLLETRAIAVLIESKDA